MNLPMPSSPDFEPPILRLVSDNTDAMLPVISNDKMSPSEWLRTKYIGAYFVKEAMFEDLEDGYEQASGPLEKADITATTLLAAGGQVYERARGPEILGTWLLVKSYSEILEWGEAPFVPYAAAAAAGLVLGASVYAQQKLIGKNWVRASEIFPKTYETVNQQWPKVVNVVEEVKPDPDHRVSEGYAMFQFGVTPFIASAKAANPNIPTSELAAIEKRVTRRGAGFSAALGTVVLGARSAAADIPGDAARLVNSGVDKILDWITNPLICIALFSVVPIAKQTRVAIQNRSQAKTAQ